MLIAYDLLKCTGRNRFFECISLISFLYHILAWFQAVLALSAFVLGSGSLLSQPWLTVMLTSTCLRTRSTSWANFWSALRSTCSFSDIPHGGWTKNEVAYIILRCFVAGQVIVNHLLFFLMFSDSGMVYNDLHSHITLQDNFCIHKGGTRRLGGSMSCCLPVPQRQAKWYLEKPPTR